MGCALSQTQELSLPSRPFPTARADITTAGPEQHLMMRRLESTSKCNNPSNTPRPISVSTQEDLQAALVIQRLARMQILRSRLLRTQLGTQPQSRCASEYRAKSPLANEDDILRVLSLPNLKGSVLNVAQPNTETLILTRYPHSFLMNSVAIPPQPEDITGIAMAAVVGPDLVPHTSFSDSAKLAVTPQSAPVSARPASIPPMPPSPPPTPASNSGDSGTGASLAGGSAQILEPIAEDDERSHGQPLLPGVRRAPIIRSGSTGAMDLSPSSRTQLPPSPMKTLQHAPAHSPQAAVALRGGIGNGEDTSIARAGVPRSPLGPSDAGTALSQQQRSAAAAAGSSLALAGASTSTSETVPPPLDHVTWASSISVHAPPCADRGGGTH